MQVTHRKTEDKYQDFREQSRQIAQDALPPGLIDVVNLKPVDSLSLSHSKRWEISESRKDDANWSWEDSIPSYSYRNPKRFDLAIWYANSQLCGLCIGKPTFTGARLRLDVIAGPKDILDVMPEKSIPEDIAIEKSDKARHLKIIK